jgi:hypothetical protein
MKESKFTGSAWAIFGRSILSTLSAFLLFIPLIAIVPSYYRWYFDNILIDGKKVEFDYDGVWRGAFGWFLFSSLTFGLGSFYASKRIMKFVISHTHFVGGTGGLSDFNGTAIEIFGYSILCFIAVYFFLIPIAWAYVATARWGIKKVVIDGESMSFVSEDAWFGVIGWAIFALITFGLGSFYAQKRIDMWLISHTHIAEAKR